MGLFKRWAFEAAKKKAASKGLFDKEELTEGFYLGAFLLGFFTFGIGYLVCLFVAKDSNFTKWCGLAATISLALAGAALASMGL